MGFCGSSGYLENVNSFPSRLFIRPLKATFVFHTNASVRSFRRCCLYFCGGFCVHSPSPSPCPFMAARGRVISSFASKKHTKEFLAEFVFHFSGSNVFSPSVTLNVVPQSEDRRIYMKEK